MTRLRRHIRLSSDPASFPRLIATVDAFAEEAEAPAALRYALHLVVEELTVNIMRHGYCGAVDGWIDVVLEQTSDGALVCVEDEAPAFDPFAQDLQPDTDAPLSERAVGGLGLLLVRHVAATVRYERVPPLPEAGLSARNRALVTLQRDGMAAG